MCGFDKSVQHKTTMTIKIQNTFITLKVVLNALPVHSHPLLLAPSNHQSVSITEVFIYIQYSTIILFCVWLLLFGIVFLRFIHVVLFTLSLFLLLQNRCALNRSTTIYLSICLLMSFF